ncbi:MAG: hypothetical protein WDN48_09560 [Pseudolabrys sp.]
MISPARMKNGMASSGKAPKAAEHHGLRHARRHVGQEQRDKGGCQQNGENRHAGKQQHDRQQQIKEFGLTAHARIPFSAISAHR